MTFSAEAGERVEEDRGGRFWEGGGEDEGDEGFEGGQGLRRGWDFGGGDVEGKEKNEGGEEETRFVEEDGGCGRKWEVFEEE